MVYTDYRLDNTLSFDSPNYPSFSTPHYFIDLKSYQSVQDSIEGSMIFGIPAGKHYKISDVPLGLIHHGTIAEIPALTRFRTALDDNGRALSIKYQFEKSGIPINLFLLMKNPWLNAFIKQDHLYSLKVLLRSPDKDYIPRIKNELVSIIEQYTLKK